MRLNFIQGDFIGDDVDLADAERFVIGRAEGSDLRVPDPTSAPAGSTPRSSAATGTGSSAT